MRVSYSISCHHITSHSILFFVRSVGAAWLSFAGGSVRRASSCVRMHACGRVRGCSAFRFGPFTHGDGLGDGGVGNPPPRGKHMELNESCLCLWKYIYCAMVGGRVGSTFVQVHVVLGVRIFGLAVVAQDSGFRMLLLARDSTHTISRETCRHQNKGRKQDVKYVCSISKQ
jgi:hypothetical protein